MNRTAHMVLVLALLLAGCASEPPSAPEPAEEDECLVERPGDLRCMKEDTLRPDDRPHRHDYWGGQERLVVMDEVRAVGQTTGLGGNVSFSFQPPPDHVIPQGTATVEVTLTWQGDAASNAESGGLRVRTAADDAPWPAGPIQSGETLVLDSTNEQNDLPHQRISAWLFRLDLASADPVAVLTHFTGEVTIHVVAVRGLEIPLHSGHPDRWDGQDRLPLFEAPMELRVLTGSLDVAGITGGAACISGCFRILSPDDGAIVPFDAAWVEVTLEHGQDTQFKAGLSYHGAASREFQRIEPFEETGPVRVYRIPVQGDGDGPYALQSLWRFQAFVDGPAQDGAFAGEISLTAAALRNE